jgi:F-type H+-transporting ATPase subunit a
MSINPLKQFLVKPIIPLEVLGYNLAFSNSALFMLLAMLIIFIWGFSYRKSLANCDGVRKINRIQAASEFLVESVEKTLKGTCGTRGLKYIPEIFSLYFFIVLCNLLGMIPGGFTVTSHILVTFILAMVLFIFINIIGFYNHGLHYFSILAPKGTPGFLLPLMIVIELFTYLSRPISLSLRLAANMTAGHIVLKVFASFAVLSGIGVIFPFAMLIILTGFEFFVAILQAYIFTILASVYLNDALNLH